MLLLRVPCQDQLAYNGAYKQPTIFPHPCAQPFFPDAPHAESDVIFQFELVFQRLGGSSEHAEMIAQPSGDMPKVSAGRYSALTHAVPLRRRSSMTIACSHLLTSSW